MKRFVMILLLAAMVLSGCSGVERNYRSVTTHVEQGNRDEDSSVLRASDYQELVSAILQLVSTGAESGTVRLYQYSGGVEADLQNACDEVLEKEPVGAYALSGLEFDSSRILSYYECEFTLTYRHSAQEIKNVGIAYTQVSLREQLQDAMDGFEEQLVVRTGLTLTREMLQEMMLDYYHATPTLALGLPSVSMNQYGESESGQYILEVLFYYPEDRAVLIQQREEMSAIARAMAEQTGGMGETEALWQVYRVLAEKRVNNLGSGSSVYHFLIEDEGSDREAALCLLMLCQELGLEAVYAEGILPEDQVHSWVIVNVDGVWRHMDLFLQDEESGFLHSDPEMDARGYQWDTEAYPACPAVEEADETVEIQDTAGV